MLDPMDYERWYEVDRIEDSGTGLGLVHHGEKDPGGHAVWRGDGARGVLYGTVSNADRLGLDRETLFEGLLDRPSVLLPKLDGPFAVACLSTRDDRLVAATDRLATRSCYYAEAGDGVLVGSELKALLPLLGDPELDERAVADLLGYGHLIGEKTLVEDVRAIPPASLLEYEDGDLRVRRYWEPEFGRHPVEGYVEEAADVYRRAVSDVAGTIAGRPGLWLSGGLDSRTMAAVLGEEVGWFRAFTYDGNPPDGSNLKPARRVAEHLGADHEVVDGTSHDGFADLVRKGVSVMDGMNSWVYMLEPDFLFRDLHGKADVIMEAAPQGELFGEGLWTYDLQRSSSAVEPLDRRFRSVPADRVAALLDVDVDPEQSLQEEAAESDKSRLRDRILDVWLRNFTANSHFRTNKLPRSQVGTRVPFASGDLLDHVAKMPDRQFRRNSLPYTRGTIPRSMAPLKRDVLVEIDADLARIPYERTRVPPSWPLPISDATYVAKQLWWELVKGRPTAFLDSANPRSRVTEPILEWLDSAASRPIFDADEIGRIQDDLTNGRDNHVWPVTTITTLELWLEENLD